VISLLKSREIQVVIGTYGFLGFCDMGVLALTTLMWSTSIEHGGLGLSTYAIGMALGWYGILDSLFQVMFLGKIMRRFGARKVFIFCFSCLIPTLLNFPVSNYFARQANGTDWKVWAMVVLSLATQSARSGAYG
jgi:MFS family permease